MALASSKPIAGLISRVRIDDGLLNPLRYLTQGEFLRFDAAHRP
jgi:hypothetical protein